MRALEPAALAVVPVSAVLVPDGWLPDRHCDASLVAYLSFWDTHNPLCGICGEGGRGMGCEFGHRFRDHPVLEGCLS